MRQEVRKNVAPALKIYDSHTHGEIHSRVTNDMDLILRTLRQSLAQVGSL